MATFDMADTCGFAIWSGTALTAVGHITRTRPKADRCDFDMKWKRVAYNAIDFIQKTEFYEDRFAAFRALKKDYKPEALLFEAIAGAFPKALIRLGQLQGWAAACFGLDPDAIVTINASTWRSSIAPMLPNGKWPDGRKEKKRAAQELVASTFGFTPTDDEADAVLMGLASIKIKTQHKSQLP